MDENIRYCHFKLPEGKSFTFDHVHILPGDQITLHQSAEWEISYIIKGSGTRVLGSILEPFSSNEVIMIPPNVPHCWSFNPDDHDEEGKIENITIIFPQSLLEKCSDVFPEASLYISRINQYKEALSFSGLTLRALQKIMTSMRYQNDLERLSSLITMFSIIASTSENQVVSFANKMDKKAAKLHEVGRYIVHNFQERVSLDDVAKYFGMNRSAFCTFFKREKGKSFMTALNEYRIDCSCVMLRDTTIPIADICFAVGFNDIPHYNRTFKKLKGKSPKDYRAHHHNALVSSDP